MVSSPAEGVWLQGRVHPCCKKRAPLGQAVACGLGRAARAFLRPALPGDIGHEPVPDSGLPKCGLTFFFELGSLDYRPAVVPRGPSRLGNLVGSG